MDFFGAKKSRFGVVFGPEKHPIWTVEIDLEIHGFAGNLGIRAKPVAIARDFLKKATFLRKRANLAQFRAFQASFGSILARKVAKSHFFGGFWTLKGAKTGSVWTWFYLLPKPWFSLGTVATS